MSPKRVFGIVDQEGMLMTVLEVLKNPTEASLLEVKHPAHITQNMDFWILSPKLLISYIEKYFKQKWLYRLAFT